MTTELRKARQAGRQSGQRKLFSVRLGVLRCRQRQGPRIELREYFIPGFSHWKEHDPFEAAFARLLKDLRAEERAK